MCVCVCVDCFTWSSLRLWWASVNRQLIFHEEPAQSVWWLRHELDDRWFDSSQRQDIFYRSEHLGRMCGPPILLFKGYGELFTGGKACRDANVNTHLNLSPKLRMCGAIPPLPYTPSRCKQERLKSRRVSGHNGAKSTPQNLCSWKKSSNNLRINTVQTLLPRPHIDSFHRVSEGPELTVLLWTLRYAVR